MQLIKDRMIERKSLWEGKVDGVVGSPICRIIQVSGDGHGALYPHLIIETLDGLAALYEEQWSKISSGSENVVLKTAVAALANELTIAEAALRSTYVD